MDLCFICGGAEHEPRELHSFWSTRDALGEADRDRDGGLGHEPALEGLLARDRAPGLRYEGSDVYPPDAALWG